MASNVPSSDDDSTSSTSASSAAPVESFAIAGIAASAGGLEAFTSLLEHLPTDTGMAFVLIQHLSPDYESLLSEILGRVTEMPVTQAQDGMSIEPNRVYVIPPNTQMTVVNGLLRLAPRQKIAGKYMPADVFFESLAADRGDRSIGIVLSGTDGDGALGLKAIKVAGGITFAQCESTAKFDSMPSTAIATGNVDLVLPPEEIAEELIRLSCSPFLVHPEPLQIVKAVLKPGDALSIIFALLRTATDVDFTLYKPTTLDRRIRRRMLLHKLETLEDYAQYLQAHPSEVQALYEEILIHVTEFFRDPEAFEQLKTQVFPTISEHKSASTPIRIWVAGCSTGEEVYSIAMCLLEYFSDRATVPPIQIFATDISNAAINKARSGFYEEAQMEAVSPERRSRFFVPLASGGYQISSAIRELCVFARHNLGGDPPFSNLDLISCRNVLIYLSDPLQEHIMALFHYSLNLTGFLMLGTSESVKTASDLFRPVHEPTKIYAKKFSLARPLFSFTSNARSVMSTEQPSLIESITSNFDLARDVDQLIANRYAPVSVVVDEQMHILHVRGDTDPYLRLPPGTTDLNLLLMAREGLAIPLRSAMYQAQTQRLSVRQEQVQIDEGDRSDLLNLEVIPFQPAIATSPVYFLLIFEAVLPVPDQLSCAIAPNSETGIENLEREVIQLRQALAAATQRELSAQAHLQAAIQEHNYLNQNLRVANEEIVSSNEELRSTNEELQTAKEEIQATNEELSTTNDELRSRNLRQNRDNSDLNNFVESISVPVVMLTNELRIRRFTPAAQRLFNVIPTDIGRPFSDLRTDFDAANLESMTLEVLETLNTQEQELQTRSGYWYTVRIRPYRTTENQIDGVTIVFMDIDSLKRHATTLELARNYAESIVETVQIPLIVLDADLRVNTANRSFYELFQTSAAETVQHSLLELGHGQWNLPQLRSLLEDVLVNDIQIQNFELEQQFEPVGQKTLLLNACRLLNEADTLMILLAIEDITERQQFEIERTRLLAQERAAREDAEAANRAKDEFLSNLSHELRNPLTALLGWAQMLLTRSLDQATVTRALEVIERSAKAQSQLVEDILDTSRIVSGKLKLNTKLIDLRFIVQAAIETVQLSAEAKTIQIVADLSSVRIIGDGDRLRQVVWNLLSNAIKFTPESGRVEVTLTSVGNHAQIQVKDTGQGISADLLPHIFERFRQADSSMTKASSGLGLGLAIVKHLVELHGGTVEAESSGEGQGTTITIVLPMQNVPQESTPSSSLEPTVLEVSASHLSEPVCSLEGLQILAVDDQADTLEILKFMLEPYGAEMQTVDSARAALAALSENPSRYGLLICDIGMPEEDGYWLIQHVRSFSPEAGGQIPAIALTAYAGEEERQRAINAGFQMHIAKPIEPAQLAGLIAELVRRI
ncbi:MULTISPECIES: CheR family methyltransferase [Leptolyngbya]|uniref:CheR family methyltransferase n=1 Tax=Leptolyngbya TaxID=47251 RepID=UPI001688293D|nr:chemotaxis protein CheB [Leptolyngbya sp. FACHB-1624]MBD1857186.1 PAS domain-containing protein [Leptolyngbya sp. FACHB-1624]